MMYRVFAKDSVLKMTEIHDVHWQLARTGDIIPLRIDGKDGLYTVVKIGSITMDVNQMVADIYVEDFFAAQKAKHPGN
jgi:hypothetical protein